MGSFFRSVYIFLFIKLECSSLGSGWKENSQFGLNKKILSFMGKYKNYRCDTRPIIRLEIILIKMFLFFLEKSFFYSFFLSIRAI